MIQDDPALPAYTLRRSARRRRTMELSIDPARGLVVTAPPRAAQHEIDAFVRRKTRWARKALEVARRRRRHLQRAFVTGESLPYLGATLRLAVAEGTGGCSQAERTDGILAVTLAAGTPSASRRAEAIAAIERWYRAEAHRILSERVRLFARIGRIEPKGMVVKSQKTRWGSCGKNGMLYFNWRLALAPMAVVDYLVVHELCHLRQRGHGVRFWRLVGAVLPDFETREAELRREGWRYRLAG